MKKFTNSDSEYRQGKTKKQLIDSETFAIIAVVGLILTIVAAGVSNLLY
jgi:hypothetical protein